MALKDRLRQMQASLRSNDPAVCGDLPRWAAEKVANVLGHYIERAESECPNSLLDELRTGAARFLYDSLRQDECEAFFNALRDLAAEHRDRTRHSS